MRSVAIIGVVLALLSTGAAAHHSYADFDRDERYILQGTLTHVLWANPHIVFTVEHEGRSVRVEWITLTGAERTGVHAGQFEIGDEIIVTGSRHQDPDMLVMTVLKEISLPAKQWRWENPRNDSFGEPGDDQP